MSHIEYKKDRYVVASIAAIVVKRRETTENATYQRNYKCFCLIGNENDYAPLKCTHMDILTAKFPLQ